MLKRMVFFLLSLLFVFSLMIPVTANTITFVTDEAGLFLQDELTALEEKAVELADLYGIHAAILTLESLNGDRPQDYADNYYDQTGYSDDGVLFLLALEERDWYISTSGTLIYALTDYGIQQIGEGVVPYFSAGQWYDGFCFYLDSLPAYLHALESGAPIDGIADYSGNYYHGDQEEIVYYGEEFEPWFALSLFCGIVAGGVTLLIMRLGMNTKRPRRCASEYMVTDSWKLSEQRDMFLYSNVTKTRKQEPSKNTGGSSVHRSSSGRKHGGGGGKF